jgi:Methyltransferase domain
MTAPRATSTPGSPEHPGTEERPLSGLPHGLRWRLTATFSARSRRRRLELFMRALSPGPTDSLLDLGVTDTGWRSSNFLEAGYPWPEQITAVALYPMPTFKALFPSVSVVVADGRELPFERHQFDIGFSNAVIEHVGSRSEQRRFVAELVRTCRRVFISTPNAAFPVDPHTLLPFVHWLPRKYRDRVLVRLGHGRWAGESILNPLRASDLVRLFPDEVDVRIIRQRVLGVTTVIIAVAQPSAHSGAPIEQRWISARDRSRGRRPAMVNGERRRFGGYREVAGWLPGSRLSRSWRCA